MLDNGTVDRWRDCDGDWYADPAMLMDPAFGGSDADGCHPFGGRVGDGCHPLGAALWQW